jgi:kynurenine 3-monooxygenase
MKGRMIHHNDGKQESQIYDPIGGQVRTDHLVDD